MIIGTVHSLSPRTQRIQQYATDQMAKLVKIHDASSQPPTNWELRQWLLLLVPLHLAVN